MPKSEPDQVNRTDVQPWQDSETLRYYYHDRGLRVESAASRLGCSKGTVSRWLKKHGIETRKKGEVPATDSDPSNHPWRDGDTLRDLYHGEGLTVEEVADRLECSRTSVIEWLDRHGIDTRHATDYLEPEGPWTDENRMRDLYVEKELSAAEIANRLNCGETTVYRWLGRHGIDVRPLPKANAARDEAWLREQYLEQGLSSREIGEKADCSKNAVLYWMEKFGIDRRPGPYRDGPWRDGKLLHEEYIANERSVNDLADSWDTSPATISQWLARHGIEARPAVYSETGEDHHQWKGGYTEDRGTDWPALRQRALKADDYQCQGCGVTEEAHRNEHGVGLSIHHIRPVTSFDEPADADTVDNLVPLCRSCHTEWEGIPLRPTTD